MADGADSGWGATPPSSMPSFMPPPPPPPLQQDTASNYPPPSHHAPPPAKNNQRPWIIAVVLLVVIAVLVAAFIWWRSASSSYPASTSQGNEQPGQASQTDTAPPPEGFSPGARTYGGSADDEFSAVALNSDGSIIVAGYTGSNDGDFPIRHDVGDAVVAKLTPQGDLVWATTVGGSDSDSFEGVAINPDGTIIVAGYTASTDGDFPIAPGHGDDALLAKFSADGDLIWAKTFGGDGHDQFHTVAVSPDGTIIAAGYTASTNGDFPATLGDRSVLLAAFSPDGDLQWAKISGTDGRDEFDALAINPDGTIIVAGVTSSTNGDFPIQTSSSDIGVGVIAMYSPTGELSWYSTANDGIWVAYWAITITSDGSIIATGVTSSGPLVEKYSQGGDALWTKQLDLFGGAGLYGTALTVGDNIIAVGSWYQPQTSTTMALVTQISPDGEIVWANKMGGNGNSDFQAVRVDADGNIIAVGWTEAKDGDFPVTHDLSDAVVARLTGNGSLG